MRPLCRSWLTTACIVLGVAAVAGAGQSPPTPPANDDCLACHGDPEAKRAFHREARSALRVAARHLGLEPDQYDLRSNFAGPAVSGEITLHGDEIYVQVSIPCIRPGREVMFRRCKGRQDYLGDRNHFCDIAVLAAPHSFRALVVRETGLSINPRQQALV